MPVLPFLGSAQLSRMSGNTATVVDRAANEAALRVWVLIRKLSWRIWTPILGY